MLVPLAVLLVTLSTPWATATAPTAGPARVIGGAGGACLGGAVTLPGDGAGYQAVDLSRRRNYGRPALARPGLAADRPPLAGARRSPARAAALSAGLAGVPGSADAATGGGVRPGRAGPLGRP